MQIRDVLPIAAIALGAAAVSYGIAQLFPPARAEPPAAEPEPIEIGPSDYEAALAALNRELEAHERLAARPPIQWVHLERLASLYVARAQLTGDHADYARAEELLDRAFELAPEGAGPLLLRAFLNYTLHRLPLVEPDLARIERGILIPPHVRIDILSLRADVAFHEGRYEDAERMHLEVEESSPSTASAVAVAQDLWRTGRFEQADRYLEIAAARAEREPRNASWVELQRGVLDEERGRYDEALAHYRRADELFSGHWLVEEHIARIDARQGRLTQAERRYRALIGSTGSAELMDPLGEILARRGREEEAARLHASATAAYERSLDRLPEASYGHALRHFLRYGAPERALEIAQANFDQRPGGEASVLLAQALLRAGDGDGARARIEAVLASPYRTAELHATAAMIFEGERRREQTRLARAIRPDAMDELAWLRRR